MSDHDPTPETGPRPDGPPQACLEARLTATAVLDGEASNAKALTVRSHLLGCVACRTLVGRHESLVAAVREAPLARPARVASLAPLGAGLRRTGRALLVAVALAAVALVGAFVSESRRDGGPAPASSGPLIAERPSSTDAPPG